MGAVPRQAALGLIAPFFIVRDLADALAGESRPPAWCFISHSATPTTAFYELHFPSYSAKAVRGETWFSEQDDTVTATNVVSGRRLWRRSKITAVWLSVFGPKLIVEADGPKLMALNPATGATIWTSSPGCWVENRVFLGPGDIVLAEVRSEPGYRAAVTAFRLRNTEPRRRKP